MFQCLQKGIKIIKIYFVLAFLENFFSLTEFIIFFYKDKLRSFKNDPKLIKKEVFFLNIMEMIMNSF